MAQGLRALADLSEDPAPTSWLTIVCNSSGSESSSGLCRYQAHKYCTDIHAGKISIHVKIK